VFQNPVPVTALRSEPAPGIRFEPEGFFINRQARRRLQKPGVTSLKDPMIFRKIVASTYRRGSDIY
jgi:hypothetical protein